MIPVFFFILGMLLVLFLFVIWMKRQGDGFEQRFPPISDEEFLARCPPGTNPAVALKVRKIVADYFGVEYERVYPSSRFIDDLWVA